MVPCKEPLEVWVGSLLPDRAVEQEAWQVLARDERAHASSLRREPDRVRYVQTRAMLRRLLADHLDVSPSEVTIGTRPGGKPEVVEPRAAHGLRFNVSHSGSLALIAIGRDHEVGVDVEQVRADLVWREVAHAFFSPAEIAAIEGVPDADRRSAFFDCWVRREAYAKGLGTGLRRPMDDVEVPLGPMGGVVRDATRGFSGAQSTWYVRPIDVGPDHAAAHAADADLEVTIRRWSSGGR